MKLSTIGSLAVLLAAFAIGCGTCDERSDGHKDHDHSKMDMDKDTQEPTGDAGTDDQALIAAQEICPVSGEELGSMGDAVRVTAGGHTAFLCCEGCVKKFKKDPEKYMAILKN